MLFSSINPSFCCEDASQINYLLSIGILISYLAPRLHLTRDINEYTRLYKWSYIDKSLEKTTSAPWEKWPKHKLFNLSKWRSAVNHHFPFKKVPGLWIDIFMEIESKLINYSWQKLS